MIFLSILREDSSRTTEMLRQAEGGAALQTAGARRRRAAQALLQDLLNEGMGLKGAYRLTYESSGKPTLLGLDDTPLPSVSLTHSAGWIACAASYEGDIGIDLELAKAGGRDYPALAEAAFGPQEIAAVRRGDGGTFYRIWTLREATAKALGTGFATVTDRQDHVPCFPAPDRIFRHVGNEDWFWLADEPLPGLYLALALRLHQPQADRPQPGRPGANHSTIQLRKCHVSPELIFSRTTGIDDAAPQ
ncbi:MAG TPA: 4'-phosphopantetheinyl transferase superfamily protein [Dongiaceae bacterium]|nr:4'-phosphopantetheinyl transferase superfamily protein [Dongiaceae bacterium]